jgi:hypothetical protein
MNVRFRRPNSPKQTSRFRPIVAISPLPVRPYGATQPVTACCYSVIRRPPPTRRIHPTDVVLSERVALISSPAGPIRGNSIIAANHKTNAINICNSELSFWIPLVGRFERLAEVSDLLDQRKFTWAYAAC